MDCTTITVREAAEMVRSGRAVLVDVREPLEHARENIPGATLMPLSRFDAAKLPIENAKAVIFHCQSGNRTAGQRDRLAGCGPDRVFILEGGLQGWKAAGLETRIDRRQPIEIQRQVHITAGSLVLLGIVLSVAISPRFAGLSAFVGAGLVFAGISGWCGMARLLALMPWNRMGEQK